MAAILSPYSFGIGPTITLSPSGDTTGVKDAAAINAAVARLPAAGGVIRLAATGTWYINCGTVVINASGVYIDAEGCYISAVGAGDTFRMYDSSTPSGRTASGGGFTGRFIIDGTNAGNSSTGIHFGDISSSIINVQIRNFTGTGSIGLYLDNANFWTEEGDIRALVGNCTQQVVFKQNGGTSSFGYGNYDFTLSQGTNQQDGVVISAGAFLYHSTLRMRGNFVSGASVTTACALRITGQNGSSVASALTACRLDIQLECSSGAAHSPTTVIMDTSPFCSAGQNYGIMDFAHGSGSFTASGVLDTQFAFYGVVDGDSNLSTAKAWLNVFNPVIYRNKSTGSSGATPGIPTEVGDFFTVTLSANATISLNPANYGSHTLGVPQRVTIVITQAASGGPYTVTWPHTGSPTTSSPTVNWAGGSAPTMSAGASAVDVYDLETIDGATWYGRALQAVS